MKEILIMCTLLFAGISQALPQDILLMKNGDEIETKIIEIGINEIKYKKYSHLDGPNHVCLKSDVFMIKYENGSKDVFGTSGQQEAVSTPVSSDDFATLYFLRPKKFAASRPEIIVGTVVPDEVILKLKNGRWHKMKYHNLGSIDFVVGIYSVNPEIITVDIKAGESYYFYCTAYSQGITLMGDMKQIDKATAEIHLSELKEQSDNLVK